MCHNKGMSVIIKSVGKKKYAYISRRQGAKVIHTYIGPADSPDVLELIKKNRESAVVPEHFSHLFWDTSLKNIDLKKNADYIIERILEYGELDAVQWMQQIYPGRTIIEVLQRSRVISDKSRNFWKLWFGVEYA
jgi:hypothetical protein